MKLNPHAVANAGAALTVLCYLLFYCLSRVAPAAFAYLFNSQFLGADIARSVPALSAGSFVGLLVTITVFSWIGSYLWARLYNWFLKSA